jgi:hypothetical protein
VRDGQVPRRNVTITLLDEGNDKKEEAAVEHDVEDHVGVAALVQHGGSLRRRFRGVGYQRPI